MGLVSTMVNGQRVSAANKQGPLMIFHKTIYILVNGPWSHSSFILCGRPVLLRYSTNGPAELVFTYLFMHAWTGPSMEDLSPRCLRLQLLVNTVFRRGNIPMSVTHSVFAISPINIYWFTTTAHQYFDRFVLESANDNDWIILSVKKDCKTHTQLSFCSSGNAMEQCKLLSVNYLAHFCPIFIVNLS